MNLYILFVFLFTVLCEGKLKINIIAGSNTKDAKVYVTGVDNKLVTDKEIRLYNITKESLNKGIVIEFGKAPDDIFWQDPTTYGDLFKKFKWPEMHRNVRATNAKILYIVNEDVVLKTSNYLNELDTSDNKTATFCVSEFEMTDNTVSTSWSEKGLLVDTIHYDVDIRFNNKEFIYQDTWGNDSIVNAHVPFGISNGYKTITVNPGQTVIRKLSAKKTFILVEIEYLAKLNGNLVLDYENLYGKYHFYSPTINNIMRTARMNNDIRTTQWIQIRCYTEPKLDFYDKISGKIVQPIERKQFIQKVNKLRVNQKQPHTHLH